ncbi:MAG TPA: radical SAM protein [Candidatus Eisenbacteria bacterium]|nr:radical SAM protein [Candidatus Eisenbacteria bacterium]
MSSYPDHRTLYRLPWSLPDNPIVWLEATEACNLYCEGCYRAHVPGGHKSLATIEEELRTFARFRSFDGVSIAGGDPLTHPEVVEIVRMVARLGYKPIVNTNGLALDDALLLRLKEAGVGGFTFHIDSKQTRPGWKKKSEIELNELRQDFANRVAALGDISCAFNATVYDDTLRYVPDVLAWARSQIDKVNVVVFIAYRQAAGEYAETMDFYVGGKPIPMSSLVYSRPTGEQRLDISSRDIVAEIRTRFPDFSPCAYLNGTEKADSLKWLLTTAIGTPEKVYGYAGPRFMELVQSYEHWRYGRFVAYAHPRMLRRGRRIAALASMIDPGLGGAWRRYLSEGLSNPLRGLPRLHLQSTMIIQPADILADGRMNMCDACPDITVHEGELVWSCRLEERLKFGGFARAVPKEETAPAAEPAAPVAEAVGAPETEPVGAK